MMLEVEFGESSFVLDLDEKFRADIEGKIPFETRLIAWKEETYFQTPVEIDVSTLKGQLKVERGILFYWPSEGSFCIFYGVSQPYSPVYRIGSYIGLLSKLRTIKDGTKAIVKPHKICEPHLNLIAILEPLGFKVSVPLHEGERVIEATKYDGHARASFRLYVEDYGIHIEGEPILPRSYSPENIRLLEMLDEITGRGKYSRLDLSEDGWVTITGFVKKTKKELQDAINEMSSVYYEIARSSKIIKYL